MISEQAFADITQRLCLVLQEQEDIVVSHRHHRAFAEQQFYSADQQRDCTCRIFSLRELLGLPAEFARTSEGPGSKFSAPL